ncbi:nephrocystin-3 [Colletotrichum spaethianum]|uniref:Nephrocystin-3 n=1 Tax=Colletotrichum spaethianum TaxID=700344 RepID=A0AA37UNB1_9PEZI|nr:nephrocystin-3 [Colletotrichum spaethianum]GKT48180.1 nephrocystin-3 [Colletotrichum spaethianum]
MDHSASLYVLIVLLSVAFLYDQFTKRIPTRKNDEQGPNIVFIHGLGSNPDTTWQAKASPREEALINNEKFVNWVRDFLPNDLQTTQRNIRIFFYNYDTYWKRDAIEFRLESLGNEFLEALYSTLYKSESALVQAQLDQRFEFIVGSTKAVLFLGSPHRGTSFGKWGWMFAQALRPLGSNPSILADLGYDAFPLYDLHKNFVKTTTRKDLRIFNFFEKRPTLILQVWFVQWKQFSATYEAEDVRNIGLPVDHYGLNKFGSRSAAYETIKSKLLEVTKDLAKQAKHHYSVPLEKVDTYTERVKVSKELEDKLELRREKAGVPHAAVLHGLGGSGKSQIALDYAQRQRDRYNPILWLDATDQESMRSSFKRCATELQLLDERAENQGSLFEDSAVQAVNRWLHNRTEADDEWLVIVDNADDISWGVKGVIPKGKRGCIIITSQYDLCTQLLNKDCGEIRVGNMSPTEGTRLLLKHLSLDADSASEEVQRCCNELVAKLGRLPLAIDLAGAYIGINATPQVALSQYLADYDRHHSELLKMDKFQGLRPTKRTVWTVWNATLEKIRKDNTTGSPDLLLTLLAHFQGKVVQEEIFRLASLGMAKVKAELSETDQVVLHDLEQFLSLTNDGWDSFQYRQSHEVLVRYHLLQKVERTEKVPWAGVTMHSLVRWRAKQNHNDRPWLWWYKALIVAACDQLIREEKIEFRRHLIVHLQDIDKVSTVEGQDTESFETFAGEKLGIIYYDEGRWKEAEELEVQVMETRKRMLGEEHPDTLKSMINLASTYTEQGYWKEAEKLQVQVMEAGKRVLGEEHPDTLNTMNNLASTYTEQGRWKEAEGLEVQVMETRKRVLGENHRDTLDIKSNLAVTFQKQGRWKEAEELEEQVMETRKRMFGEEHPDTLKSMINLASTYTEQGRLKEAEGLEVQVMETRKRVLGENHPDTLDIKSNLAVTFQKQGRLDEAEKLQVQVMEVRKRVLGEEHPDTLNSIHNLASTYSEQDRQEEAEGLKVQVMEARKRVLGEEHPDTLSSMNNLASTFWDQSRIEEAEELEVQTLEARKRVLGEEHPDTLNSMYNLAYIRKSKDRWEDAIGLMQECVNLSQEVLGFDHPRTKASSSALSRWQILRQQESQGASEAIVK